MHRRGTQYECDSVFSEVSGWRGSDGMEDLCEKHGTRHSVERRAYTSAKAAEFQIAKSLQSNKRRVRYRRASAVLRMGHILP